MPEDLDVHLSAIVAGDAAAFGRFMVAVEMPVRRSLRPFAAKVDVEAVVQEAFLRLWQVAPRFTADGRPNGLFRLLLRIAKNRALDEVKRRREDGGLDLEAEPDLAGRSSDTNAAPLDPFLRRLIHGCFEGLPRRPGEAMMSRLTSDGVEADAALAVRLGMTLNTFLQNVTRARKLLADCLERQGVRLSEEGSVG